MPESTPTGAESIHWNLSDLYESTEKLKRDLETASDKAGAFESTYRGRIADLGDEELRDALNQLTTIQDLGGRAYTYAYLNWSTDTSDPERGALLQLVRERYTAISTKLLFFEVEWTDVSDERAAEVIKSADFDDAGHWLEVLRESKPHILTEPEEKIMIEKNVTGRSAWNRYFDETLGAMRFDVDGESLTQQQTLSRLHEADRDVRRAAAAGFTEGLKANSRTLTFIFNTLLADKATDDRLRSYPNWISSRNLSNEVADEDVEALIEAVTGGYDHVARYYRIKRDLLGLQTLYEYDRYAPVGEADRQIAWSDAREMVTESYAEFHAEAGRVVDRFFENEWIDAALGDAKRGGAFSHGAVPSAHPYVLMNYTGKIRDVQTLAHELGHGLHQYLSREQGVFHADTPLTTAETASVFGEMLVFQRLLKAESDDTNRLAMLMGKIDDTFATVFRQVSMNRFENRIHTARREEGELSTDFFSDAWMETQEPMFGESVTLTDDYRIWWSYIPHFLHTPGYVYAYAFGELLVLALYERYRQEGEDFADRYLRMLTAGGSDEQVADHGPGGQALQRSDPLAAPWRAGRRGEGVRREEDRSNVAFLVPHGPTCRLEPPRRGRLRWHSMARTAAFTRSSSPATPSTTSAAGSASR